MLFDIVIPLGRNDLLLFSKQLKFIKKNIIGYDKIFIITNEDLITQLPSINLKGCEIIPESIFPFSLNTIKYYHGTTKRCGWYFQQLLKLYAGLVIPKIKNRYLVIDADTFFFKPVSFIEDDKCLYNYSDEYHQPYFNHMNRLHANFKRNNMNYGGICHHMIFETKIIRELMTIVETNHNDYFYNVMLKLVDPNYYEQSGFSEYELYFNYVMNNHGDKIKIRKLNNKNFEDIQNNYDNMNDYDYVSFHSYFFDDKPQLKANIYKRLYEINQIMNEEKIAKLKAEIKKELKDELLAELTIELKQEKEKEKIILAYSFIGTLPSYTIESIHQARLYHNDDIYLIIDDFQSPYVQELIDKYKVIIINYNELIKDDNYINQLKPSFNKFAINYNLGDRQLLFYRSFERLFLINSLMNKLGLSNVLFLEIDNTIYDNPNNWLLGFRKKPIAYMNCNYECCSSGIIFIRDKWSLSSLLDFMLYYINNNIDGFNSEMRCLFRYVYNNNYNHNENDYQLLPISLSNIDIIRNPNPNPNPSTLPPKLIDNCYKNYDDYNSIFDPASYGQYLTGKDTIHTNGELRLNEDTNDHIIKCSCYNYNWIEINGLRKPFIYDKNNNKWVLINNLHIHSKQLHLALSKPL